MLLWWPSHAQSHDCAVPMWKRKLVIKVWRQCFRLFRDVVVRLVECVCYTVASSWRVVAWIIYATNEFAQRWCSFEDMQRLFGEQNTETCRREFSLSYHNHINLINSSAIEIIICMRLSYMSARNGLTVQDIVGVYIHSVKYIIFHCVKMHSCQLNISLFLLLGEWWI